MECSWAEFAEEIFKQAGKATAVEKITTEAFGAAAKRPAYSVMDNQMLRLTTDFKMRQWQDALSVYLKEIL